MRLVDPATYAFGRFGVEGHISENYTVRAMAGFAGKLEGNQGDNAGLLDVTLNRYWNKWYAGAGLGTWLSLSSKDDEAEDTDLDIIIDAGRQIYEKPGKYSVDFFVEARADIDELDDFVDYSTVGAGLRCHF